MEVGWIFLSILLVIAIALVGALSYYNYTRIKDTIRKYDDVELATKSELENVVGGINYNDERLQSAGKLLEMDIMTINSRLDVVEDQQAKNTAELNNLYINPTIPEDILVGTPPPTDDDTGGGDTGGGDTGGGDTGDGDTGDDDTGGGDTGGGDTGGGDTGDDDTGGGDTGGDDTVASLLASFVEPFDGKLLTYDVYK
jgi:hypothetical protein